MKTAFDRKTKIRFTLQQITWLFVDAWILMLCSGGLSHQLSLSRLAISYWSTLLVVVISVCLFARLGSINVRLDAIIKLLEQKS